MAELLTLGIFVAGLFLSLGFGVPLLVALLFGLAIFFTYGLWKKYSFRQLLVMALTGIRTVKNILITFILIGTLTALWRAGGTIPFIVYHSIPFCHPRIIVLATFLLCCMISVLTGTAFGTAATIGVICVTIANSMGVPIVYSGGVMSNTIIKNQISQHFKNIYFASAEFSAAGAAEWRTTPSDP